MLKPQYNEFPPISRHSKQLPFGEVNYMPTIISASQITPLAEPVWQNTTTVYAIAQLRAALLAAAGGVPTLIEIPGTLVATDADNDENVAVVPADAVVKLTGGGMIDANSRGRALENNGTLYLADITLTGGRPYFQGGGVRNYGTLYLLDGAKIIDNVTTNSWGGGVFSRGTLYMEGGEISGNRTSQAGTDGGGVWSAGDFIMTGGIIRNNETAYANATNGGGVYMSSGVFTLSGGEISGNSANFGGGVAVYNSAIQMSGGRIGENTGRTYGGGLFLRNSAFQMSGGEIFENTASMLGGGAYFEDNTVFRLTNGAIYHNSSRYGGGVMIGVNTSYGNMIMEGGEIYENRATDGWGGGIDMVGPLVMSGGKIHHNFAQVGGGGVSNRTDGALGGFKLTGGEITDNETPQFGGGVNNYYLEVRLYMSGGLIARNTAGEAGGGINNNATSEISGGIISHNTAPLGGGICDSKYTSLGPLQNYPGTLHMTGGLVAHNLAEISGGGVFHVPTATQAIIGGSAQIIGNEAPNGGGACATDLANLYVEADVIFSENRANVAYDRSPADDALYYTHIQGTHWTSPFTQGYNNYDICYQRGTPIGVIPLNGTKTVSGAPLAAGQFSFGLYNQNGDLVYTVQNDASGGFTLPALMLAPGSYTYTVKEITASGGGWLVDGTVYTVTITVSSTGETTLSIVPNDSLTFHNTYSASPAQPNISGMKYAQGAALPNGRFNFGLFDEYGNLLATAAAEANGNITFPNVVFTEPGTYHYTMRELSLSGGGWTVDERAYPVTVTVTDDGAGQLVAQVSYPGGAPSFNNSYSAAPATSDKIAVYKEIHGWNGPEVPFTFSLYDQNSHLIETAQNESGVAVFSQINYSAPGVYNYTVCETSPSGNGWTTDGRCYPVIVTVTDDSEGNLIALTSYPEGQPTFVNTYEATPANATITASKAAVGAALPGGRFTFLLFDENGSPIASATNDDAGNVSFPASEFTAPGTYTYTLRETTPSNDDWTTDSRAYRVIVTVSDDGYGHLYASVSYPDGPPAFVNTYKPPVPPTPEIKITICAEKRLCGACLCADQFTFALCDGNGNEVARAANDGCGHIVFADIALNQAGVFTYTLRELNPSGCGWEMDERAFPVLVTVASDGSGNLTASVAYPGGKPIFINYACCSC